MAARITREFAIPAPAPVLAAMVVAVTLAGTGATARAMDTPSIAREPRVVVAGAPDVSPEAVRERLGPHWWRSERGVRVALDRALEVMFAHGYPEARVTLGRRAAGRWRLRVDAGPPAVVLRARVHAPGEADTAGVRRALGLSPGARWSAVEFARRARRLVARYDEAGHPFARVWVDRAHYDAARGGVTLEVTVTPGPNGPVRSVRFEGLRRTRPDRARRLAGLEPGVRYDARRVEAARERLAASGAFDAVGTPRVLRAADGRGFDVVVPVRETPRASRLSAAVGYASAEGAGDRRTISGQAHLELVNIAGTLRDAEVFWTNDGRGRRRTRLRYADRFVAGHPLWTSVTLEQVGEDTLYTWQSMRLDVTMPPVGSRALRARLLLRAAADRNVFGAGELVRTWRWRAGTGVRLERAGRRTRVRLEPRVDVARKRETFRGDSTASRTQWILAFDGEIVRALTDGLRLRLRPRYRGVESAETVLPISEQFTVGGARTLRGFRENRFRARRAATLASELVVGRRIDESVYVFVDAAWLDRRIAGATGVRREVLTPTGFGFGFRTAAAGGTIDLSFGVGDRVSLRQTKVHVILEQRF